MTATGNLFAQQEANRKASRRLVAGFIIFVAWLGFGGDIIWFLASRNSENPGALHVFPGIGIRSGHRMCFSRQNFQLRSGVATSTSTPSRSLNLKNRGGHCSLSSP